MSRIAFVTGAASGIGQALSAALAQRGDTVVLADINEAGAKEVAPDINGHGRGKAIAIGLDVRESGQVAEAIDFVVRDHGRLNLMLNNAGIGVGGPVEELSPEHWDRIIDVNLRGVINGVHAADPVMIRQGHGHILPPIPRRANANRAIIVSPMTAQVGWRLFRLSPSLVMRRSSHIVRSLAAQAMEKV